MGYFEVEIEKRKSYSFTFRCQDSNSRIRESIRAGMERAMRSLERAEGAVHSVAFVPGRLIDRLEELDLPVFKPGKQYIVFAVVDKNPIPKETIVKIQAWFEDMAERIDPEIRLEVVQLPDCILETLETS